MDIKSYLEKYKMKPLELAAISNVSVAFIYKIMAQGKKPWRKSACIKIVRATEGEISMKDLTGEEEWEWMTRKSTPQSKRRK